jgi:hypothetical protein
VGSCCTLDFWRRVTSVDQRSIGKVAKITTATTRNVIATPSKIHWARGRIRRTDVTIFGWRWHRCLSMSDAPWYAIFICIVACDLDF